MNDIGIFVSLRTDLKSRVVSNPLYIPILCGASYDKDNMSLQGDNTGDNISEKKISYSELTVQYWMWKNIDQNYYGLCHYRRYLSFAKQDFHRNEQNQIIEPLLSRQAIRRHCLEDMEGLEEIIKSCDAIFPESADVRKIPTPGGLKQTVRELWEGHDGVFINKADLETLIDIIHQLHPEYIEAAEDYLSGTQHRGYNCFILCKHLFFEMCQFQFDILFELENRLDMSHYTGNMQRTLGYMGEILFGIYSHKLFQRETVKVITKPLVYFEETRIPTSILDDIKLVSIAWITYLVRGSLQKILPIGSKRREKIKKVYHWIKK